MRHLITRYVALQSNDVKKVHIAAFLSKLCMLPQPTVNKQTPPCPDSKKLGVRDGAGVEQTPKAAATSDRNQTPQASLKSTNIRGQEWWMLYDLRLYTSLNLISASHHVASRLLEKIRRLQWRSQARREASHESRITVYTQLKQLDTSALSWELSISALLWELDRMTAYMANFLAKVTMFCEAMRSILECPGISRARYKKVTTCSQRWLAEAYGQAVRQGMDEAWPLIFESEGVANRNGPVPIKEDQDEDELWGHEMYLDESLFTLSKGCPRSRLSD